MFFRNNKICTKCISGSLFNGVKYKCYQNSYIKSLAVYSYLTSIRKNKILDKIDKFIVFTKFSKDIYSKIIDKNKIIIKPNFTTKIKTNINIIKKNKFFLFVGRISSEKGIDLIINNLNQFKINIKIIGDGPLLDRLKLIKSNKIQFLGKLTKQKTIAYMKKAECLLFTSKWYEGMPMVILEAMSVGLPIVSSRLGNMKYIIKNNFNGLFFNINLKYDLSKKANYLYKNKIFKKLLKKNSINVYKKKYSSSTNYIILKNIYQQVLKEKLKN
jgi:glycosyltransferase involved in cell wall biosynthesis